MKLIGIFCIIFLVFISAAVETPFEKVIKGFNMYVNEQPQEKIYVHLDRSHYFVGETIWLKSYLVAGPTHEPSEVSSTIYIELFNNSQKVITQIKQFVIRGSAAGSIVLPDTLKSGSYFIRAYTKWMRNFKDEYFFYRTIRISDFNQANERETNRNSINIQFFPEGGDLVTGISSRVAFKAISEDGLAREVQGKIIDSQGNFITSFKSNFLGMGAFMLDPEYDKTYKAIIEGVSQPVALPVIKNEGIALSVINLPQQDKVSVRIQAASYSENEVYLLVQSRGVVSFSAVLTLATNGVSAKLDKAQLPEGITQITLMNKNGQPLCERLIYIEKPESQLKVELKSDKDVYSPREKITVTIETRDVQGKPVAANLSLAVSDDQQNQVNSHRETIHAYLNLSSDLRGYIESPGYYFDVKNTDRHLALDWLLMTQGWRRFTVSQALDYDAQKLKYQNEHGITVKGKMIDQLTKKPISGGKVTYLGLGSLNFQVTTTNAVGEFELQDVVYYDSSKLVLQGETKRGKKWIELVMDTLLISAPINFPYSIGQIAIDTKQRNLISSAIERKRIEMEYGFDENTVILSEIEIKAKREKVMLESNRIYGAASKSVVVAGDQSLENFTHPLQLLQGRVAGVLVKGSGLSWTVSIRGLGSSSAGSTPLILIDNQVVPLETLNSIPVRNIESYDVWKGSDAAIFGAEGGNGAIAFYTKKTMNYSKKSDGIIDYNNGGYKVSREFYSPAYDVDDSQMEKPDKRVTLFWAPNIQTDSITGRAKISFYNHDVETSVTSVLEGISAAGTTASAIYHYKIIKK